MYRDKRVVAWIPYGRELTVSVLLPYLLRERERGIVDEIWFCMNTDPEQGKDRDYAQKMAFTHKVIIKKCPGPDTPELVLPDVTGMPAGQSGNNYTKWAEGYEPIKQRNTGRFPYYMQDRDAIFVRFDDDIVWLHKDAVTTLADRVIDTDALAVFAFIWNNAISSWLAQKNGRIPTSWGIVGHGISHSSEVSAVDPVGWADPIFAEKLHKMVLEAIESNTADSLLIPHDLRLGNNQQYSVSCFGISGNEYADQLGVLTYGEEEHWLTKHRPDQVNRANIVCGWAQVAHFSFLTQREYLLKHTNILDRYRELSEKVEESL